MSRDPLTTKHSPASSIFDDFESVVLSLLAGKISPSPRGTLTKQPSRVTDNGDSIIVSIDVPGVSAESIDVSVENRVLLVNAQRAASPINDGERLLFDSTQRGALQFTTRLAEDVDVEKITANYRHGVLTITVPKTKEPEPKRIQIVTD